MSESRSRGQIGYEAYAASTKPWQTYDGKPMPTWKQLGETGAGVITQARWTAAADAIEADIARGSCVTCTDILATDPLRHFRECEHRKPLPAGHPMAERAEGDPPAVYVTIAHGDRCGSGVAANAHDLDAGIRRAAKVARFNLERSPGCTCDAAAPEDDRCNAPWMRCEGAIAGQRAGEEVPRG